MTPRLTRLVRVPDPKAMQRAIADAAGARRATDGPAAARDCVVLVPTSSAAAALRLTLENLHLANGRALLLPDLLTRAEFYERLHQRSPGAPPLLSGFEREVICRRATLDANAAGTPAPFRLRPGLIGEILGFYDDLRRRERGIEAFDRLMTGSLEASAEIDRGAERLMRLTRFLSAAFQAYEQRVAATGAMDEHHLRAWLLDPARPAPYRHVIVTVADQSADARGLWPADYTLLARMPGLERLDIVATEQLLGAGFHQRIHDWLPGIEEEQTSAPSPMPVLSIPEQSNNRTIELSNYRTIDSPRWFVCRDREEELAEVARDLKRPGRTTSAPLSRTAVVFQRPLPYLYLARQVFGAARIPYQAFDALPLAAEPQAAALDLVFSFLIGEATRASVIELLASPNWTFHVDGRAVSRAEVSAADELLRERKYIGGWDRLAAIATEEGASDASRRSATPALQAAAAAALELRPVIAAPSASAQISTLLTFMSAHEALPDPKDAWYERHHRARAAIRAGLQSLGEAHRRHDDGPLPLTELTGTVRRWIEGQTFAPRTGAAGVLLMDAPAAAYADVDAVRLVGLVETDWPERSRRSIFYPPTLLAQLGWPSEIDRLAAARARFRDLLRLPTARISLSTFTLEDDAIVSASPMLEELESSGLPVESEPAAPARIFVHEAMTDHPLVPTALSDDAAEWLAVRASRTPAADLRFHGEVGPRANVLPSSRTPELPRAPDPVYAVSRVERYLDCPFKYFAAHVLNLPEERRDQAALTPQERGQFLHEVFENFFREWQAEGGGAITKANLDAALELFGRVANARLATLSEGDRALERTYLLGSAVAPGLAERAFAFEIEQAEPVIERLLEHTLEGEFEFTLSTGSRQVRLRAKADRIDLLADGTLRVIDYKLGKAPKPSRSLQLAVYGACAEQRLGGRHGRPWKLRLAGYVAFKEKNTFVPLGGAPTFEEAAAAGRERFLAAIDAIERGSFPVQPDEPFLCTRCGYAALCRKDYIGDE